jgi:hypothetical protein
VIYDFDEADPELTLLPMAARRALDAAGCKLALVGYQSLPYARRVELIEAGAGADVDPERVRAIIAGATPAAAPQAPAHEPSDPPPALLALLATKRALPHSAWDRLTPLDRYVLVKLFSRARYERLQGAFEEIARRRFT